MIETIYRDKRMEILTEGGLVHIVKKYDFGGFRAVDTIIMTADEVSKLVKAWNELGGIEIAETLIRDNGTNEQSPSGIGNRR